jgi:hypothetical protein
MVRKSAWFLNFDADDELARPAGYTPSRAVLSRFGALRDRARALVGPGDVVLEEGQSVKLVHEYIGISWCPTPRALRALQRAGASISPEPALEILRAVNHRRFSADLGQTLPGARYAFTKGEVDEALSAPSPSGMWLLKRPFGFAGRGRLRLDPASARERALASPWIEASLRSAEGIQIEPFVDRLGDFALHGYVRRSGEVVIGSPTKQACDDAGAWIATERADPADLSVEERRALFEEAGLAGRALHGAGYFGPFGVDAFRYAIEGARRFNPRCEINARFSMGWAIGMGETRPDRDDEPGEPRGTTSNTA